MRSLFAFSTYLALTLVVGLSITACGGRLVAVGGPRGTIVAQGEDPDAVRDAIARALAARRFTVESQQEGMLIARYDRGRVTVRIRVDYSASEYRISYVDSVGLNYSIDPNTQQPVISRHYPRYVTVLERTIQSELGRPAREAQEAAEAERERAQDAIDAQREHELALQREETDRQLAVERSQRRDRRRERWAQMSADQQRTARAQADADRARAEAEAERLRRLPPPVFSGYDQQPVVVERFAFEESDFATQSVQVQPGFRADPYVVSGQAAGNIASRGLGLPESCPGFWTRRPQHVFTLPVGMQYLRVDVSSNDDTTLAVVTPDGQVWCDDDGGGNQDPRLAGQFPAGTYAVYVGTYQRGRRARYNLELSEQAPRAQAAVRVATRRQAAPAVVAPDCRQVLLEVGQHPSYLAQCEGVEPYCAAALLRAGQHPSHLPNCRGVQPACAVALIEAGQSASYLTQCRGVEDSCAVALLRAGQHPSYLSNCR